MKTPSTLNIAVSLTLLLALFALNHCKKKKKDNDHVSSEIVSITTTKPDTWKAGEASDYKVTFTLKESGLPSRQVTVNRGDKAIAPTDYPQATYTYSIGAYTGGKYILGDWYTDEACTQKYDFNTAVQGDMTLYRKWQVQPKGKAELLRLVDASIAEKGNTVDLNFIDTSLIRDMSGLFSNRDFNGAISQWDVSKVTTMSQMFYGASAFNQDISQWNVAKVKNTGEMFVNASSFNQDISQWDVSNVSNMGYMFAKAASFNQPIGNWNVEKVRSMSTMFYGAKAFNQPIGNWNVAKVKNMFTMFSNAASFNQPIGNWNVENVTDMGAMFDSAAAFNQDLSKWNVTKVTNCVNFSSAPKTFWPQEKRPAFTNCNP